MTVLIYRKNGTYCNSLRIILVFLFGSNKDQAFIIGPDKIAYMNTEIWQILQSHIQEQSYAAQYTPGKYHSPGPDLKV